MNKNNSPTERKFKGIWIGEDILQLNVKGMLLIHRILLAEVEALSNPDQPCTASNLYLAHLLQVSPGTISKSLHWLNDRNLIKMWFEKSGKNARRMLSSYQKLNDQYPNQNDKPPNQNEEGFENEGHNQSEEGLNQIDKRANQNEQAPYQIDNHREPLEYILEYLQSIEREKSLSQKEEDEIFKEGNTDCKDLVKTSPQVPRRPPSKKPILFRDSEVIDLIDFCNSFVGTDYEIADLNYYHEILLNWSDSGNKKKNDWIATARSWMLRDKQNNKLVISKSHKHLNNEKSVVDPIQAKRVAEQIRREALEEDY